MKRKNPFLDNQHPQGVYREPLRSSSGKLNGTMLVHKNTSPATTFCSMIDALLGKKSSAPQTATSPNGVIITPQPNIIKLYSSNPVAVGVSAIQVMLPNPNRTGFRITNVGTTIIYIGLGKPVVIPSITAYDHVLPGCSVAHNGTGGVIVDDIFLGAAWAISSSAGGLIALVEEP